MRVSILILILAISSPLSAEPDSRTGPSEAMVTKVCISGPQACKGDKIWRCDRVAITSTINGVHFWTWDRGCGCHEYESDRPWGLRQRALFCARYSNGFQKTGFKKWAQKYGLTIKVVRSWMRAFKSGKFQETVPNIRFSR